MHGGKTPRGRALPQTTHGRYSKDLPTRLAARYLEASADTELLNLRDEIAVVQAFVSDLLTKLNPDQAAADWAALGKILGDLVDAFDAAATAQLRGDKDGTTHHLNRARGLAGQALGVHKRGAEQMRIMAEVGAQIDRNERLVRSERQRVAQMDQMVRAEQMVLMFSAFLQLVAEHVDDRKSLEAIRAGLDRLLQVEAARVG